MASNVFSVTIFFIVFRETLEAAVIISVLLGLVEQIVHLRSGHSEAQTPSPSPEENGKKESADSLTRELADGDDALRSRRLIRKMRFQEGSIPPALLIGDADTAV
jgi:high-affinity iron transporter